ncbi:hypothetical protein BDF19DRAFT_429604, partial [Syncephalis fuscata]
TSINQELSTITTTTHSVVRPTKIHQLAKAFRRHTPVYLDCTRIREPPHHRYNHFISKQNDTFLNNNSQRVRKQQRQQQLINTASDCCTHAHCKQAELARFQSIQRNRNYHQLSWHLLGIFRPSITAINNSTNIAEPPIADCIRLSSRSIAESMEIASEACCLAKSLPVKSVHQTHNANEVTGRPSPIDHKAVNLRDRLASIENFLKCDLDPLTESMTAKVTFL